MFGIRFKKLREDKEISQKQMAEILNTGASTISMWEKDKRTPDKDMIIKIADYFNVSIDYLFGRTNNPNTEISKIKDNNNIIEIEFEKGTKEQLTQEQLQQVINRLKDVDFNIEKLIEKIKEEEMKK